MLIKDVFPSKYIKADDLNNREVKVVIANVTMETLGNDQKLVLYFQHKDKGLITDKTNAGRISYLYGDDTDGWIGREIVLASEFTEMQGKTVKCIRVRPPANGAASPSAPASAPRPAPLANRAHTEIDPPPVDDIPF